MVVSYRDKYGPLGKIAALAYRMRGDEGQPGDVTVDTWVMSCRAFARRVEHRCLEQMFLHTGARRIELAFATTERNGPTQALLSHFLGTLEQREDFTLDRDEFFARLPALYSTVEVHTDV